MSRLSPVQRFALYSFIVVSILGLLLGWGLSYYVEAVLIQGAVQSTALVIQPMMSHELRQEDLRGPMNEARRQEFERFVAERIQSERIARLKIWNREGMVVYSDDPSLIGRRFPVQGKLRRALDGEIAFDPSNLEKEENVAEKTFSQLLEIYVPLQVMEAKEVVGAYEVYAYWQPISQQVLNVRYLVWGSLASGLALLYLLLFGVFRNASRVIRRQRNRMRAVYEANKTLAGELGLEALLEKLMRSTQILVKARYVALGEFGEDGRLVRFLTLGLAPQEGACLSELLQGRGLLRTIQQEGKSLHLDDIARGLCSSGCFPPVKTCLGVPIVSQGRVLGSLYLMGKEGDRPFSEEDQLLVEALATDAVVAIRNAQLHQAVTRRLTELSALFEVSSALREARNVEEMLPIILDKSVEAMDAESGHLELLEDGGEKLAVRAIRGSSPASTGQQFEVAGLPTVCPVRTGRPAVCPLGCPLYSREHTFICAPLATPSGVVGSLTVGRMGDWPLPSEATPLLTTIASLAGNAIHRAGLHEELEESYLQTVLALANAMDARDTYTADHGERLAARAVAVAWELGCSEEEIELLRWGALLHDVGKIGVPDRILLKPGPLNDEERVVMQQHPEIGAEIVEPVKRLQAVAPIIRHHQERWDGTGYPAGLKGQQIPLGARILAVVDAYGAITDDRIYRKGRSHEEAVEELKRNAGTQFDPQVVGTFLKLVGS